MNLFKNIVGKLGLRKSLLLLMLCPCLALAIILGVNIYDHVVDHKEKERFVDSYETAYNYQKLGIYSYGTSGFIELWKHGPEMGSVSGIATETESILYQVSSQLIEHLNQSKPSGIPELDFVLSIIQPRIESVDYCKSIIPVTDRFLTIEKDLFHLSNPFIQSGNIVNIHLDSKPFSDQWTHALYLEKVLVKISMGRILNAYHESHGDIRETAEYKEWIWNHELIKNQLAEDFEYIEKRWQGSGWFIDMQNSLSQAGLLDTFDEIKGNPDKFSHRDFEMISAQIFDQFSRGNAIEKSRLDSDINSWLAQSRFKVIRQVLLLLFFAFLMFAILECGIKAISDPIRELTDKTNRFAMGDEVGELPDLGCHDMGRLCNAIQSLEDTVEHFSNSLNAHSNRIQSGGMSQPLEPEAYQGEWRKIAETMVSNIEGFSKLEQTLKDETNDRLKLERSLHDSQKDELVIRFVEGVSGDFSNLLATFVRESDLSRIDSPISEEDRIALEQIHQAGMNARRLVGRLMAAAGLSDYQNRTVMLYGLLQSVHTKCSRLNWHNTTFSFEVEANDTAVAIDPESFEDVLLNLIENANHACVDHTDGCVAVTVKSIYDGIEIAVQDNGVGISLDDQSAVCDPFFTTKEREGFGGLGLTMAKSLAEKSGGRLTIESAQGRGTKIVMVLKCAFGVDPGVGLSR